MARERFILTTLPHSCAAGAPFHISLFVSPQLVPDEAEATLGGFRLFSRWAGLLTGPDTVIELADQDGPIEARPLLEAVDPSVWDAAFPPETPVRVQPLPEWEQRRWRSFRLATVHDAAKVSHMATMLLSATTPPAPSAHPWTRRMVGGRRQITAEERTRYLDKVLGEDQPLTDNRSLAEVERIVAGEEDPFARLLLDLQRARRYYERPESQDDYAERPDDPPVRAPALPRPVPDFHERCALAGDHRPLLLRLGLALDVVVDDPDRLRSSTWLSACILAGGDADACRRTRTRCQVVGDDLVTVAGGGDWHQGRLRLGDPERFSVLDLDADGSALKLERFMWTLPGLAKAEANGDPVNAASPALRSPGFTVARTGAARSIQERLARQRELLEALDGDDQPLLDTEDVTRGYRVEVWDDVAQRWATLHARHLSVDVDGRRIVDDAPEHGWVQGTAAHETPGVEHSPVHIHEAAFGWEGWSLSAPRPGRRVRHDEGGATPEAGRADAAEVVEDPDPGPVDDPATPIVVRTRVQPGSLPRLRYGRSYALRAWAVDLAGNSSAHAVGGGSAPSTDLVAAMSTAISGPGGTSTTGAPSASSLAEVARTGLLAAFDEANRADAAAPVATLVEERFSVAGVALDPGVLARARQRRGDAANLDRSAAPVSRAGLVERAVAASVGDPEVALVSDVAVRDAGPLARMVAAEGVAVAALPLFWSRRVVSALRPFLRWDPVLPPAMVARHRYTAGESLRRVVVRSGVSQDRVSLAITVTPPDAYAAAADPSLDYQATAERHLVPPKTSQPQAELHGAFDDAIGSTDPGQHTRLLAVALRESGTLFDVDVPGLDDPTRRDPQPGIALEHETSVTDAELVTLPLALGTSPPPGQYVVHDTATVAVPYLPDVVARGVSLVFPEAGLDRALPFPFATEGFTVRYEGDWPALTSYRLVLSGAAELGGRVEGDAVHLELPPGDQQRMRISSCLDRGDLELFGPWRSLAEELRTNDNVAEAAADGWLWGFTPPEEVVAVHAVTRPLEAPRATSLRVERQSGSSDAVFLGGVDVHGPSTDSLAAEASWTEMADDLTLPRPEQRENRAVAFTTPVLAFEDLALLGYGAAGTADTTITVPGVGPVRGHRAAHRFGDTKHRQVRYRFRATTRFREYFDPAELAVPPPDPGAGLHDPVDDGRSVVGPATVVSVPSSAPPAAPLVHSVIPLFRWDQGPEPEQPVGLRRRRRGGVRIYLERPWFTSGDGELLGVLLQPEVGGGPDTETAWVSQWGADPVWSSAPVARRTMALELEDALRFYGLDDRNADAGPVSPPRRLPLSGEAGAPDVTVLGYQPQFNEGRALWYVDIAIDPGDAFWPFVRLVVARYQPDSVDGCHLSKPVRGDFVQVTPERTTSVARTDDRHVRVVVSGPVGTTVPADVADAIALNRTVVARLQRQDPALPTDLGWETVDVATLSVRGQGRTAHEAAWVGSLTSPVVLPVARPGEGHGWRVTVEEWERLPGDPADLGQEGPQVWERRLVYADEVAL